MIDWNNRNGGFLDDFNVMNYQVSDLSQQIDKLQQELQRKDNKINKIKSIIENSEGCKIVGTNDELISKKFVLDVLDKIKELEGS